MPSFRFTVLGQPPSWNASYRITRYRDDAGQWRRHMSKAAGVESYQLIASSAARRARPAEFNPEGLVVVRYALFLKKDMDASNCLKILEDAVAAGLDVNDRIFLPQVISKEHGHAEPRVEVEVSW